MGDLGMEERLATCHTTQQLIDINSNKLYGLRTRCSLTDQITQEEIQSAERKLVTLFSKLLVLRSDLHPLPKELQDYPKLANWLQIVGLDSSITENVLNHMKHMDELLGMSTGEVSCFFKKHGASSIQICNLNTALRNLKCLTASLLKGVQYTAELAWSVHLHSDKTSTSSLSAETSSMTGSIEKSPSPVQPNIKFTFTPPSTPTGVTIKKSKFTPPPQKRNQLDPNITILLTKSTSHDNQLGNSTESSLMNDHDHICRRRSAEESTQLKNPRSNSGNSSPTLSTTSSSSVLSQLLSSPFGTPNSRQGYHHIKHRFYSTLMIGTCSFCKKNVVYGKVCRECKSKFHRECAQKAAPACGLPNNLLIASIKNQIRSDESPSDGRLSTTFHRVGCGHRTDSTSTSSNNSSTPSSPAISQLKAHPPHLPQMEDAFTFPGESASNSTQNLGIEKGTQKDSKDTVSYLIATNASDESDRSDQTTRFSDTPSVERNDSIEIEGSLSRVNSISGVLKEWEIPFDEITLNKIIWRGRSGIVHQANWHGLVAVKLLTVEPGSDLKGPEFQAFKMEVATLHKTRHENLVLFMGASVAFPQLAIVTSFCRGSSLHTYIHGVLRSRFNVARCVSIGSQICHGLSYLHAKNITHKDLKSKNIFLEQNGKVIVTGFGIVNVSNLCQNGRRHFSVQLSHEWLCYLAPEILRCLNATEIFQNNLPYSAASDSYAFGTIWYEMLALEWPYKGQSGEAIIYQAGSGKTQSLDHFQNSAKDLKDVISECWQFEPDQRPDFRALLKILEKLPKKRLARSPSHPIRIGGGSAEASF